MDIGAKIGKRPQIADSLKYKSEPNARFRVGINLTSLLWPEQGQ